MPKIGFVIWVVLLAPGVEPANRSAWLAPFAELERRLGDPDLRLLDTRPRAAYDKSHIPGAVWVDAKEVESMAARPGALADRTVWQPWLESLGIGSRMDVLICDGNRQLDAARLWWLLRYLGVERLGLIDGNFSLWVRENRPVTAEIPKVVPRPFTVDFRADIYATRNQVLTTLASRTARIIDARTQGEYTGAIKRSKRAGHVPDACHIEWNRLVDQDGRFHPDPALRAILDKSGVKAGERVITHCQGGGRASVDAFVFERLGFSTRNYYAGWSDWGNAADTPVEDDINKSGGK